jgi:hypothetical protein
MKKQIIYRVEYVADGERRVIAFRTRAEARDKFMDVRQQEGVGKVVLLKVELLLTDQF